MKINISNQKTPFNKNLIIFINKSILKKEIIILLLNYKYPTIGLQDLNVHLYEPPPPINYLKSKMLFILGIEI